MMEEKRYPRKWQWFLVFAALPVLTWALLLFAAHTPALEASAESLPKLPQKTGAPSTALDLPIVGSAANLQKLLEEASARSGIFYYSKQMQDFRASITAPGSKGEAAQNTFSAQNTPEVPAAAIKKDKEDFSTTNLQVENVDEADIVKTDGQYLYQVNRGRIVITRAHPPGEMKICSILPYRTEEFTPLELYVDQNRLVVIGTAWQDIPLAQDPRNLPNPQNPPDLQKPVQSHPAAKNIAIYPPPRYRQSTLKTIIYDISNKENVRQLREVELEGSYVTSRRIGPALYLVANKNLDGFWIMPGETAGNVEYPACAKPAYRDTALQEDFVTVGFEEIRYFPGFVTPNYLLIAGINLDQETSSPAAVELPLKLPPNGKKIETPSKASLEMQVYLGAGENIYASLENLYAAVTSFSSGDPEIKRPPGGPDTSLFKFALANGSVTYTARGKVPGTVLNQFSMDEYKGNLRVATTTTAAPSSGSSETSQNNVYILDPGLQITGRVEDLAPGEKIYSARFLGKRGYMVTFRTIDPLFVLDLQDPQKPRLLGALKIPGYSDYLHPYDENHLLGFGKETMEIPQKDHLGRTIGSAVIELGMKLSLFDVSDVQKPVEKFKTVIGGPGTQSELLHNHKALLWSKEKNLLAFPLTVLETKNNAPDGFPGYCEFTFQGAYIYNLDLQKGFQLQGKITHLDEEDYRKAGQYWYDSDKNVERILYIGDTLYTLSPGRIKANALDDLQEIGSLQIPRAGS